MGGCVDWIKECGTGLEATHANNLVDMLLGSIIIVAGRDVQ